MMNFAAALCLFSLFLVGAVGGRARLATCNNESDSLNNGESDSVLPHND